MRKLFTKLYVGDHIVKVLGRTMNFNRSANTIVPSILLTAIGSLLQLHTIEFIGALLILITVTCGFVLNKLIKPKIEDLDPSQKFQLSVKELMKPNINKEDHMTNLKLGKSDEVQKYLENLAKSKNYNVINFLVNPLSLIVSVLIIVLFI